MLTHYVLLKNPFYINTELQTCNMKMWELWAQVLQNSKPLGQLPPLEGGHGAPPALPSPGLPVSGDLSCEPLAARQMDWPFCSAAVWPGCFPRELEKVIPFSLPLPRWAVRSWRGAGGPLVSLAQGLAQLSAAG